MDLQKFKRSIYPLDLQNSLQELHLIDQRPLIGMPLDGILQRLFKVIRKHGAQHPEMFLVLPPGLVEAEQTVALAFEEQARSEQRELKAPQERSDEEARPD